MIRRRQPEQELQRSVIAHLQWRARPGVWWTHIPLGGLRSKVEAAILRGLGTVRGCPDLLIVADGKAHFLELKARSRVTPEQHACHEALRAAGACVAVAYDIDDAIEWLKRWRLLRSHTSTQIGRAFEELRRGVAARRAARNSPHITERCQSEK
jgi:hypothetical protein